jgi:glycogen operon protein
MDPYAKAVARTVRWADEMFGYEVGHPEADLSFDARDNAAYAPLAAVVDPAFTWGDDRPPRTPWHNTVIYECTSAVFPSSTLTFRTAARHLRSADHRAGARALQRARRHRVELMPVHHHRRDRHLEQQGLTNYWGYNSVGYFAPERRSRRRDPGRRGARVQAHGAARCTPPASK